MTTHLAKPEHEIAYQDICDLVRKHADKLTALEMLAVASNFLGKLVALQDQRTTTPQQALEVVRHNIQVGNEQAIAQASETKGTA